MSGVASADGSRPLGRIDGRYTIVSRLGKGSMGVVYRAHDEQIDRQVAVKVMMADAEGDEIAVERFRREARAMGRLLHRNVVTVYNMGESAGRHYIVMELLEGCTLSEWVKAGGHALEDKVDVMLQACDGLAVAHSAGIIHRDIKPNNLFIQVDGTLKIVDFGIARLASSNMTRSGLVLGTPHYMSPEQARGAEVDERSDVFSVAAVFHHVLSGRKPFDGNDLPIVLHRVAHDDPQPLSEGEAPAALARIIVKGLRKAPDKRYQSVAALAADLARFKRQFDGETRRLVTSLDERFDGLRRSAIDLETARTTLGLSGASPVSAALSDVMNAFPVLGQSGPGKARAMPDRRDAAVALDAAVTGVEQVVDEERTRVVALQQAVAAGERALGVNDPDHALEALRGGIPWLHGEACPPLQALVARAQALQAEQHARADYMKTLLEQGREAEASGKWAVAVQCANDALSLSATSGEARALLSRANQALAEAAAAKAQSARRLHEQAEAAISAGRFEQVARLVALITEIDATDTRLPDLLARFDAARSADAKRAAEIRAAAEVLASTRAAFAAGRRDDAIAALDAFVRLHPTLPAVEDQLRKFQDESARISAAEARAAEAQSLVDNAERAWRTGDVDACEQFVDRALALRPDLASASELLQRLRAKRAEIEAGRARQEQAAAVARAAVVALARGRFDLAEAEARRALALDPHRGDAAVVLADVPNLVLQIRRDAERQRADAERARTIDQLIHDAHGLLSSGDYEAAAEMAERANDLDSTRADVATLLTQSRAVRAAARAGGWGGAAAPQESLSPADGNSKRPSSVRQMAEGARAWFSGTLRSKQ